MDNVSNNLEWMNKHFVLLQYPSVKETVEQGLYPSSSEIEEIIQKDLSSEDYIHSLESKKDYKEGCTFLAYNLHNRAAVWWAYRCVVDLLKELKKSPHKPRDIEDIGKPRPLNIPDWAKAPEIKTPNVDDVLKEFRDFRDKAMADHYKRLEQMDPEIRNACNEALEILQNEVRKQHGGKDLFDLFNMTCENAIKNKNQDFIIDTENSPLMKAKRELEANLEKMRKETIETVKASLPKVDIKLKNKQKLSALDCVYSYIASPDEENANKCYLIGNKCPDTPEGLLALCAFWSFGDLMPLGKNVVKTPTGLFGNGMNSLMLMMALAPGGEKKLKQRYETYFNFGCEVGTGKSNWSASLLNKTPPHVEVLNGGTFDTAQDKQGKSDSDEKVTLNSDSNTKSAAKDESKDESALKAQPGDNTQTAEDHASSSVYDTVKNYLSKRFK